MKDTADGEEGNDDDDEDEDEEEEEEEKEGGSLGDYILGKDNSLIKDAALEYVQ